jgi:hypothetical protein
MQSKVVAAAFFPPGTETTTAIRQRDYNTKMSKTAPLLRASLSGFQTLLSGFSASPGQTHTHTGSLKEKKEGE